MYCMGEGDVCTVWVSDVCIVWVKVMCVLCG